MEFSTLFKSKKPLIACIHLLPLPGAPGYSGSMYKIMEHALSEAAIFKKYKVDGLIIENFRDHPFYPNQLRQETIASMTAVTQEVVKQFTGPVGVNALRNDAHSALAIAVATDAQFIRVNVHTGAAVTDQGIIEGKAHETLRLRKNLAANVLIFADVAVKHASPLGHRDIELETRDLTERGMADSIIVTGNLTGSETNISDLKKVRQNTHLPIIVGSGTTPENIENIYPETDGFIVGSYFKKDGKASGFLDEERIHKFISTFNSLKKM